MSCLLEHEGIIFKRYPTYPDLFAVSEMGYVLSLRGNTPRILKQRKTKSGYMTIATKIGGRNGKALLFRIYRMVIETWGNPPTRQQIRDSEKLNMERFVLII